MYGNKVILFYQYPISAQKLGKVQSKDAFHIVPYKAVASVGCRSTWDTH
jgi:hypothetical protein